VTLAQLFGAKEHALAHDFSRREFHDRARRNFHCFLWLFRIAADAFFGEADFKNTEVAKFHIVSRGKPLSDSFERQLDHAENLLLSEAGFFADLFDEIVLGKIWHKPFLIGFSGKFCKTFARKIKVNQRRRPTKPIPAAEAKNLL
jgi:hypothetical protein